MKTGKTNILMVNKSVHKVLHQYLDEIKPSDKDYLFRSRKGINPQTGEEIKIKARKVPRFVPGKALRDAVG